MNEAILELGEPFKKQIDFLNLDRFSVDADGMKIATRNNYVGGRGCSKTTTGILLLLKAVQDMPGLRGFWAEPTWPDMDRVFIAALSEYVPKSVWRLKMADGHKWIEWHNGHRTDLLSRFADNPKKPVGLGGNYSYGIQDEAADRFDLDKFILMHNAIRDRRAPYLFHDTLSTPLMNGYEAWCLNTGNTIFANSRDNPYMGIGNIEAMEANMSPELVRQQTGGEFIHLSGRIWSGFKELPWPDGNIIEGMKFDPSKPWYLSCDLGGAQGSYQIVQYLDPVHNGRTLFKGKLAVIVAELVPNRKGINAVLDEVIEHYAGGCDARGFPKRKPEKVIVGHDVNNPGTVISSAAVFGPLGWEFVTPQQEVFTKDIQYQAASALIFNTMGHRRMAVAANKDKHGVYQIAKQHWGEGKRRGILNVMRADVFPDDTKSGIFVKDKSKRGQNALEDDRDAFLYWVVCNHPPSWNVGTYRGKDAA
jgi:hypothetical protein